MKRRFFNMRILLWEDEERDGAWIADTPQQEIAYVKLPKDIPI